MIYYKFLNGIVFGKRIAIFNIIRKMSRVRTQKNGWCKIHAKWTEKLQKVGVPEAELSIKYIIEKALGEDNELTLEKEEEIAEMCAQRLNRKPIQYIIGDWDFRHLKLLMKPPVFIPRPETEDLVDIIGSYHQLSTICKHPETFRFLEVGCGSGAICLSLLSENPQASCVAIDVNPAAVSLTKHNGMRNGLQDRLTVTKAGIGSFTTKEQFDAIISNPPYIPSQDMNHLQPEIKRFEDGKALCGGEDGLDVIKDILLAAPQLLKPNGSIWLEVDLSHPREIRQWICENPSLALQVNHFYDDFTQSPSPFLNFGKGNHSRNQSLLSFLTFDFSSGYENGNIDVKEFCDANTAAVSKEIDDKIEIRDRKTPKNITIGILEEY